MSENHIEIANKYKTRSNFIYHGLNHVDYTMIIQEPEVHLVSLIFINKRLH